MHKKINEFRKKQGLTAEAFTKKIGLSSSAVLKVLYGEREPSRNFLKRMKQAFPDADMNDILTD